MTKWLIIVITSLILTYPALANSEISQLDGVVSENSMDNVREIIPDFEFDKIVEQLKSGLDINGMWDKISNIFLREVRIGIRTLAPLIGIMTISGLMLKLSQGGGQDISTLGLFVCFGAAATICLASYYVTISYVRDTVGDLALFVQVAAPLFGIFLAASGKAAQSVGMPPIVLLAAQVTSYLLSYFIIPAMHTSLALALCGNISDKLPFSKLSAMIKSVTTWVMCGCLTIFVGLLGICTTVGGGLDAVSGKAAKFAISSMVPVAGGIVADATDTVVHSAILLKNAGGAASILFIVLVALIPLMKIFIIMMLYRFLAATCQAVSDRRLANTLEAMSTVLSIGFTCTLCTAALMIITFGGMIAA